jgi:hypothetical protein
MPSLFSEKINAAIVDGDGGRIHIARYRDSLLKSAPEMSAETHHRILRGLINDNLATEGGAPVYAGNSNAGSPRFQVMTIAQAAAATREPEFFRSLMQKLTRIGYDVTGRENERISVVELHRCLKASGETNSPELRMEMKAQLYHAGLLEP